MKNVKLNDSTIDTNNMSDDFKDVNSKNKYRDYIIVVILYAIVVILAIFLIFGLKHQKNVIKNNNTNVNNSIIEENSDNIME